MKTLFLLLLGSLGLFSQMEVAHGQNFFLNTTLHTIGLQEVGHQDGDSVYMLTTSNGFNKSAIICKAARGAKSSLLIHDETGRPNQTAYFQSLENCKKTITVIRNFATPQRPVLISVDMASGQITDVDPAN